MLTWIFLNTPGEMCEAVLHDQKFAGEIDQRIDSLASATRSERPTVREPGWPDASTAPNSASTNAGVGVTNCTFHQELPKALPGSIEASRPRRRARSLLSNFQNLRSAGHWRPRALRTRRRQHSFRGSEICGGLAPARRQWRAPVRLHRRRRPPVSALPAKSWAGVRRCAPDPARDGIPSPAQHRSLRK